MMLGARTSAWGGKRLPYDAEVEWIENEKGGYIDTGIIPTKQDIIFFKFSLSKIVAWNNIFGCITTRQDAPDVLRLQCGMPSWPVLRGGMGHGEDVILDDNYKLNYEYDVVIAYTYVICNNNRMNYTGIFTSSKYSIYLGGANITGVYNGSGGVCVFAFSIKRAGLIISDMIPVRKNGVGYMYDRVSGQLFGNSGTGEFIIGPDKTT